MSACASGPRAPQPIKRNQPLTDEHCWKEPARTSTFEACRQAWERPGRAPDYQEGFKKRAREVAEQIQAQHLRECEAQKPALELMRLEDPELQGRFAMEALSCPEGKLTDEGREFSGNLRPEDPWYLLEIRGGKPTWKIRIQRKAEHGNVENAWYTWVPTATPRRLSNGAYWIPIDEKGKHRKLTDPAPNCYFFLKPEPGTRGFRYRKASGTLDDLENHCTAPQVEYRLKPAVDEGRSAR